MGKVEEVLLNPGIMWRWLVRRLMIYFYSKRFYLMAYYFYLRAVESFCITILNFYFIAFTYVESLVLIVYVYWSY